MLAGWKPALRGSGFYFERGRGKPRPYKANPRAGKMPALQNYSDEIRWTRVRRETPVGPLASQGLASSFQAVPAMSRWIHGVSPANSRMNHAPGMEPPPLPLP